MNNWILAGVLIIMIVTAAAAAVMLLLDAMERRKEQPQQFSLWKLGALEYCQGLLCEFAVSGQYGAGTKRVVPGFGISAAGGAGCHGEPSALHAL